MIVEGQLHGSVAAGLGQALMENTVYDDGNGQLVTGSFMDYAMPRADDMPPLRDAMHNVPATTNPLGVKGVGEAGTTAAISAVMNAVADAIPNGAGTHLDMPASAPRLWQACQRAKGCLEILVRPLREMPSSPALAVSARSGADSVEDSHDRSPTASRGKPLPLPMPVLLSFVAGYVDSYTYLALFGLFVAQVTSSFVIAGAELVTHDYGVAGKLLVIVAFLVAVALTAALVGLARDAGRPACRGCWRSKPCCLRFLPPDLCSARRSRTPPTGTASLPACSPPGDGRAKRPGAAVDERHSADQRHDRQHDAARHRHDRPDPGLAAVRAQPARRYRRREFERSAASW